MPKTCLLAIDQGTTSSRAIVFDKDMQIMGVGQKELTLHYPHNGWVEQDAQAIWDDTLEVCRTAIKKAKIKPDDIAGIGITNQRETTIVWDRETGKPVYNAIVWQDRRTADRCAEFVGAGHEDMLRQKTGLLFDSYFSGTKLQWILENVEGARAKATAGQLAFGTVDCFLLWHLTEGRVHATDATNASRTMMYNIVKGCWDKDLLELFDVPESLLPEVLDCSTDFGVTGLLGADIPIGGIAGDQQAAMIGQACFVPGMMKSTYGTGCFALMNIGSEFQESKNRLLTTIAYRLNGETAYAIEGSIFIAGAAVQWLRDGLKIIQDAAQTEQLVRYVEDTDGVYMVPAFTGLGAPYWDPDARGAILGLTRNTSTAHIVRAALEAQGYQTRDLMQAMIDDTGQPPAALRVDGGMVANDWMCQFLSDITDLAVERPAVIETTALGAAYLAGLQVGLFQSLDDISQAWRCAKSFTPDMMAETRTQKYQGWQTSVGRIRST